VSREGGAPDISFLRKKRGTARCPAEWQRGDAENLHHLPNPVKGKKVEPVFDEREKEKYPGRGGGSEASGAFSSGGKKGGGAPALAGGGAARRKGSAVAQASFFLLKKDPATPEKPDLAVRSLTGKGVCRMRGGAVPTRLS